MKARKFFSMFMIAAAICTTGFMMTSCQDEDDVVEVKYKWENINVKSSDTYSIANEKEVVIDYSVDVRMLSNVVIDEIKNLINKNITDGVKNLSWSDEYSFSASVKNILNNIPETDKYSFQNSEVTAELVKNIGNINSVSIEEGTLFTSRHKLYVNRPNCYYIWSKDWTGYSKLKVKTCEIKYSDNLEIDGDAKDFLFEKVNVAVSDYIGGLVMKDLYLSSDESIDVFLDNVLIECEKHIKGLFNMENDNFEIVDFEIMKGAAKNYWINSCAMYGDTSGYDYKYIYNEYKAWKDNR